MANNKIPLFLIMIVCMCLCMPIFAAADGGFFPRWNLADIFEPTQKAVILFDGAVEQLIIEPGFQGDVDEFAWIVPTPTYPQVNRSDGYIFVELSTLTQPKYRSPPYGGMFGSTMAQAEKAGGVTVYEQKQVGIYEVSIISSDNPLSMVNWLNENNYSISSEAVPALSYYTSKGWYFTAMRINLGAYDVTLLESLKKIDPAVTNVDDAITILTDDLTRYVRDKKTYNELTNIISNPLNYGEADEQMIAGGRPYGYDDSRQNRAAKYLIEEDAYNLIYQEYNGYFEANMQNEVSGAIQRKIDLQINLAQRYQCYNKPSNYVKETPESIDFSSCSFYYVEIGSNEWNLISGKDCGDYCKYVSANKATYTIDDVSRLLAYLAVKGDQEVMDYFAITDTKPEWHYNEQDQVNYVYGVISSMLVQKADEKRMQLQEKKTEELIQKYKAKTGMQFSGVADLVSYLTDKTMQDFKSGKTYAQSYISGMDLIHDYDYTTLYGKYSGHHRDDAARASFQPIVRQAVTYKQVALEKKLSSGAVQPIMLKFSTPDIIYPLRISSVNKGVSEILLYVFAKYRTKAENYDGFEVEYAKWIETKDIRTEAYLNYVKNVQQQGEVAKIRAWYPATYARLNELLDDRYFLTKMRKEMWPREMTDDVMISQAENNKSYRKVIYSSGYVMGWIVTVIGFAILYGILFGITCLIRLLNNRIIKNKGSVLFISIKRAALYPIVFVAFWIMLIYYPTHNFLMSLGRATVIFPLIGEFLSDLLRFFGMRYGSGELLLVIIYMLLVFVAEHLIISAIIAAVRKARGKKAK